MNAEVKERLLDRVKTNPYVNHLGVQFTTVEDGIVEARMPLHDEQRQYSGVIHGGVLAALADTIAGFAAYIKPGRHVHFSECEIYCDDKLVSKASGTFSVVQPQV